MRTIRIYKTYAFKNQDPIVDEVRTVVRENPQTKPSRACELSGVSKTTWANWRSRKTMRPQFATLNAFLRAYDFELGVKKRGNRK